MKNITISNVSSLPTKYGNYKIQAFKEFEKEHLVIFTDNLGEVPFLRIHSECITGDALGSLKCDCGDQLIYAQKFITKNSGMIIYHRQEGRNIGLVGKVNAYALQDEGLDTVEANHKLGFKADERTYDIVEKILKYFNINKIKLLTNNIDKISALKNIEVVERISIKVDTNIHNEEYLKVKKNSMGHIL